MSDSNYEDSHEESTSSGQNHQQKSHTRSTLLIRNSSDFHTPSLQFHSLKMAPKLSIVETEHKDKITLDWTLPDFKKLYDTTKAHKKLEIIAEKFTVGGIPWGFRLQQENPEDVGIYLEFFGSACVSAKYSIDLKSSGGRFKNTSNVGQYKYAPRDAAILGASQSRGRRWKSLSELHNEGFLTDGNLHLRLTLCVYSYSGGNGLLKMQASEDIKNGLDSAVGSNVTFVFVEEEGSHNVIGQIKAHRGILALRSSVFATMFGSGMKEATDGEVRISDMSPEAMRILLNFLYSGDVDPEWGAVAEELIYGADKYNLAELQKYLCANLDPAITVKNVMKIRNLGELYNLPDVLKSTSKFISENTDGFLKNHRVIFMEAP